MKWYWIVTILFSSITFFLFIAGAFYERFFKRVFDIVLSGVGIIILFPLLVVLTIVGAIAMRGNPFFVQPRPGKINNKTKKEEIFKLIKFRTMDNRTDGHGNLLPDGIRLNRYGKFLRKTSLDELGELFNIFIGDMTIIGPRPQLVRDMVFMTDNQRKRHMVLPGLTGWAQVNGRNNISWERKFELDLEYVNNISLWNDLKILLLTVKKVIDQSDTVREGTESDLDLGDWLLEKQLISKDEYEKKQDEAKERLEEWEKR